MNLHNYLEEVGDARAAELFGVTVRAIRSWRYGEREPRPDQARTIVRRTDGLVDFAGIYAEPIRGRAA